MKLPRTTMISVTMKVEGNDSLVVALQLHIDTKPNYIMLCPMNKDTAVGIYNDHMCWSFSISGCSYKVKISFEKAFK